jgi:hypothetical protein
VPLVEAVPTIRAICYFVAEVQKADGRTFAQDRENLGILASSQLKRRCSRKDDDSGNSNREMTVFPCRGAEIGRNSCCHCRPELSALRKRPSRKLACYPELAGGFRGGEFSTGDMENFHPALIPWLMGCVEDRRQRFA